MSTIVNPLPQTTDFPAIIQQQAQLIDALKGEVLLLKEQLAWLKKQVFGQKSERIIADLDTQPLLPEIVATALPAKEPEKEQISYERAKVRKNKGCDTISYPDDLPVKRVELDVPESEKFCPQSGVLFTMP
jgi:hypothetical protein